MPSTPSYAGALLWAEELHRGQLRKGKEVPYIAHLIAVSALVWEDGGDEEQAIAGLLHDLIEDAGVSSEQIAERFGQRVGRIVADCTDTAGPVTAGGRKEPWLLRKRRYIEHLQEVELDSLMVSAADKAHNACDQMLDARRDPACWSRFRSGLDGAAWYQLRIHRTLVRRLSQSRSTELLGEAMRELLASNAYRRLVPEGIAPAVWATGYLERQGSDPLK